MARSIAEIQEQMLNEVTNNENLVELNSTSKVSVYRLMIFIVAVSIWTLEKLFDIHTDQVNTAIFEYKPGTFRWYRNMALAFQYGFDLLVDDDQFDNTGATQEQIDNSKIVKYCSIKEGIESSRVIIKIAGDDGTNLNELTPNQLTSFTAYMKEVSYAGVKLTIINNPADKLKLNMTVYRDPLVLDENGINILTGAQVVNDAINSYIKNLPFDGELVVNDLIEYLRDIDGIENVNITTIQSSYKDLVTGIYSPFATINVETIPVAGYFQLEPTSIITYVV